MISDKVKRVDFSTTMEFAAIALKMKAAGEDLIDLTVGEPDFPTPEYIKNAAKESLDKNLTKYTLNSGILELREAISEKYIKEHNIKYKTDQIIISTGAKQSLFNSIQVLVNTDDEVIIPVPTYVSYIQMVKFAGGKVKTIQTKEADNFKLTPIELEKNLTDKTKLLVLCNPSNPTGSVYSQKELKSLIEVIKNRGIYVVCDEIYEKLVYDNIDFISFASIDKAMYDKTIIVNGFSKSFSMTGWRIGYALANEEIISNMAKLQSHTTSNASSISQYAALTALSYKSDFIDNMRNEFEKRRNSIYEEINKLPLISAAKPAGAFYLFVNISKLIAASKNPAITNTHDFCMYLLNNYKVAIVPGYAFGTDNYIRISFASNISILREGLSRISTAITALI